MSGLLQYDPAGYRGYLRFSHEKHLLVEGRDDKRIFGLFLDEFFGEASLQSERDSIRIDSAEHLIGFGSRIGNREKVEMICESVRGLPYANRLVGFVDREFREFERGQHIRDRIRGHKVSGRLVWSRGHSVENYYFDFGTLCKPLRIFSITEHSRDALDLFESVLEQTIRLACAASLAGDELGKLKLIRRSADREIFEVLPSSSGVSLTLRLDIWKENLVRKHRLSEDIARRIIERFQFWNKRVKTSDFHVVRWICHGHIGLAFIWAAYSRCVLEICQQAGCEKPETEAQRVLKAEESVRFNACADLWVQRALGNHCDYPVEVLRLLGLDVPGA